MTKISDMKNTWQPNYQDYSPMLQQFANHISCGESWPSLADYNAALPSHITNQKNQPIQFVPQAELNGNYEIMVYETGCVPTRDQNWHDFFNAHVWLNFPKTKATLNALQYRELTSRTTNQRSRLENKLTLFDENGAIVICDDPGLMKLLFAHHWEELFWERRDEVLKKMKVIIFGHSMHEKALTPYIGMTAHALCLNDPELCNMADIGSNYEQLDEYLSIFFDHAAKNKSILDFQPLPVLGYPGWYNEAQTREFYQNKVYFRPK